MIPVLPSWLPWKWLAGAGALVAAVAGFFLWLHFHDAAIRREQKELDRVAYEAALQQAELIAIKSRQDAEENYRRKADEADEKATRGIADARALANRYILRSKSGGGAPCATPASTGDQDAEGSDGPGGTALVDEGMIPVPAEDIRVCSINTARLIEARAWALGLDDTP